MTGRATRPANIATSRPIALIVAKQLGSWASTGVDATQVSNTLAQAANASTVGVEELALGLSQVGGVAKVSGVSFHELNQTDGDDRAWLRVGSGRRHVPARHSS